MFYKESLDLALHEPPPLTFVHFCVIIKRNKVMLSFTEHEIYAKTCNRYQKKKWISLKTPYHLMVLDCLC